MISRLSCFSCCDYLLGLVAMFELCAFMNHALKWPLKYLGSTKWPWNGLNVSQRLKLMCEIIV